MAVDELGLIRTLVRMGIPLSRLTQIPWLTTGLQGTGGLLNLIGGAQSGDVPQAIGGAASAGANAANLLDAPGVAGVLGNVAGPLGLATGLARGNPMQAILGGVQTGSAASGYLGGPTISSALSSLLGGGEAGAVAGGAGAASIAPGIGAAGWALNPATIMGGMLLGGGLMGKAQDAEASARAFKDSREAFNKSAGQMGQVFGLDDASFSPNQLPGTLSLLRDTLGNAPNLGLYTHLGTTNMPAAEGEQTEAAIQRMRAQAGQDWLRGLDAAQAQGVDLTGEGGALRSPFRAREGGPTTLDLQGGLNVGLNDEQNLNLKQIAHLLDLTEPEAQQVRDAMAGMTENGQVHWNNVLENAAGGYNPALAKAFNPEKLAMLKDRIGFNFGAVDPDKVNKLLDEQWLTSTIHDAVHDVGRAKGMSSEQLAQAGIAPGSWQGMSGGDVYGGGMNAEGGQMPSQDELAAFPGAGLGLSGLLAKARDILGNDWGGTALNAPYVNHWNDSLDWAGMPPPRPPTGLPQPVDVNIGGGE